MNRAMQLLFLNKKMPLLLWGTAHHSVRFFRRSFGPTLKALKRLQRKYPQNNETHRNTHLEWNYDAEIYSFGKRLNENFDDSLLKQAFTERSYVINEEEEQKKLGILTTDNQLQDNRDMSEKGEIIMRNFITQYLRYVLPRFPEEGIMSITEYLMSEDILSNISYHIGTSELILCSDFPVEKRTMTTVLKALVYALSESSGIERATLFVRDFILTQLAEQNINELWPIEDPIKMLTTICHNEGEPEPEPRLIGEAGVNTILACYRAGLYINKQMIGLGFGESPEIAHEMAARDALRRLFKTAEHQLSIPFDIVLKPQPDNQIPNVTVDNWCEENLKKHESLINPTKKDQMAQKC